MLIYYEVAALSKKPCALADGLMLVFQQLVKHLLSNDVFYEPDRFS
jgi:hypothetical protein